MLQFVLHAPRPARPSRCCVAPCRAPATLTPVLRITLLGSDRASRVTLPAHVCAEHRQSFAERFLTAARRASIETALQSRGRGAPDWPRTDVDFELE